MFLIKENVSRVLDDPVRINFLNYNVIESVPFISITLVPCRCSVMALINIDRKFNDIDRKFKVYRLK
jgi:hypothetical protein